MRQILLLIFVVLCPCVHAQRVLLFEKLTESKSERVYEGEMLRFRLKGDKFWQEGYIREMRPDIQALVINDRFVMLDEIDTVWRGHTIASKLGYGLITFGAGWSIFAAVGYATDGLEDTHYSFDDAAVTLTSVGIGYALIKVLGQRKFRTGKYRRLRIVDLNF